MDFLIDSSILYVSVSFVRNFSFVFRAMQFTRNKITYNNALRIEIASTGSYVIFLDTCFYTRDELK